MPSPSALPRSLRHPPRSIRAASTPAGFASPSHCAACPRRTPPPRPFPRRGSRPKAPRIHRTPALAPRFPAMDALDPPPPPPLPITAPPAPAAHLHRAPSPAVGLAHTPADLALLPSMAWWRGGQRRRRRVEVGHEGAEVVGAAVAYARTHAAAPPVQTHHPFPFVFHSQLCTRFSIASSTSPSRFRPALVTSPPHPRSRSIDMAGSVAPHAVVLGLLLLAGLAATQRGTTPAAAAPAPDPGCNGIQLTYNVTSWTAPRSGPSSVTRTSSPTPSAPTSPCSTLAPARSSHGRHSSHSATARSSSASTAKPAPAASQNPSS
jgi:hypothetical protein